jgi:hypothetical protein
MHDTGGKVPVPCAPSASAGVLSPHSKGEVPAAPVNFSKLGKARGDCRLRAYICIRLSALPKE